MGWFSIADPNVLHPIFTGRSPSPSQVTVTATGPIGLYFASSGVNATEYSTQSLPASDNNGDNNSNLNRLQVIGNGMAVFQQTGGPATNFGSVVLGFEDDWDTNFNGKSTIDDGFRGDSDYNDLIVGVSFAAIPEPGTIVLFGCSSLVALVAFRRRNA
jgi:hypothetical protein